MSSYPINTTIPAAKNTPAQDQPKMQTNFANIAGFLAVNHTAPGTDDTAGTHTLVQFPKNVIPPAVSGNYTPVLFTNNQDGKQPTPNTLPQNELFFFSGSVLESIQQYIVSTNGSTMLFGGIILKWAQVTLGSTAKVFQFGSGTDPNQSYLNVNDFPNNAFCAVASGPSTINAVAVTNLDKTSITLRAGTGPQTCYVIIIGN